MRHKNKAIVVGSINMDIVAFVDHHPKIGETILGREVNYFPGGKGCNQAVACKRMGCETSMIARLGDDAFGDQLLAFLQQEGIDIHGVRSVDNVATGCAFITVSKNGENSIIVISGANAVWNDDFASDLSISADDIVLAQFEINDAVIYQAFKKAKASGAMTILNPAPVRQISPEIRSLCDILVVNEHELAALSACVINANDDESIFNAAERLGNNAYDAVIVTLGNKGIRLSIQGLRRHIAAKAVAALDTTAAGDTFIGGLTAGLLSGLELYKAAELANAAAAISVTRPGAASSIPMLEEVRKTFALHAP